MNMKSMMGFTIAFGLGCFVSVQAAGAPGDHAPTRFREDRILVKPRTGVSLNQLQAEHGRAGAVVRRTFPRAGRIQIVHLPRGLSVEKAIRRYRDSGLVEYAEPDYQLSAWDIPNDPYFANGSLWGLHNTGQNGGTPDTDIDAPEAWSFRTSSASITVATGQDGQCELAWASAPEEGRQQALAPAQFHYPDAWIALWREGDDVTVLTSPDGADWTETCVIRLPELADTVYVGLNISSGSAGDGAAAMVEDFAITPWNDRLP